jgi:hypothetical protein
MSYYYVNLYIFESDYENCSMATYKQAGYIAYENGLMGTLDLGFRVFANFSPELQANCMEVARFRQ